MTKLTLIINKITNLTANSEFELRMKRTSRGRPSNLRELNRTTRFVDKERQ